VITYMKQYPGQGDFCAYGVPVERDIQMHVVETGVWILKSKVRREVVDKVEDLVIQRLNLMVSG
jgi:hypothetical protein